jgi:hypothetical protein
MGLLRFALTLNENHNAARVGQSDRQCCTRVEKKKKKTELGLLVHRYSSGTKPHPELLRNAYSQGPFDNFLYAQLPIPLM